MSNTLDNIATVVAVVLIGIVVFFGALSVVPKMRQSSALDEQLRELHTKTADTEREIARIQSDQRRFREDPRFLETLARERQRVYPGELVFVFDDSK